MNIIDLNGKWTLSNERKKINCPATVPGCVHTDLTDSKIIDDPFYRVNEYRYKWIAYEDWTYTRDFSVTEDFLKYGKIFLECMGLDTIAEIFINDNKVAETISFHRRYAFEIKDYIRCGANTIKIIFTGPASYAEPLAHTGTGAGPVHHTMYGSERMRKSLYQWGWDWGPEIPTCGIWRDIFIKGYNEAKCEDFIISKKGNTLEFTVKAEKFTDKKTETEIEIKDPENKVLAVLKGTLKDKFSYNFENPKLWYPKGYGDQPLYTITLKTSDETIEKKYGFRTAEWTEDKDQWGKTFYLKINGVPVFLKGANHIPLDQFPSRITKEHREKILRDCIEANMNCLRIWGGGHYEYDDFYDTCDRLGILIWHDFMFGNSHYPMDDEKLCFEYTEEPKDNIRRLRHHPSIVIWSGNNEIEQNYFGNWPYKQNEKLKEEYKELFVNRLGKLAKEEDPERKYIRTSAHSETVCSDPNLETDGDSHYWKVWGGPAYPYEEYREHTPRLLSEFGFQSMPSLETVKTFTIEEERDLFSQTMQAHQKSGYQNNTIRDYINMYFRTPKTFENIIYLSQINQGNAIKCAVEHNRRNMNDFHCMGTLYWQLGDCWPGITWSSIEYDGRWKALHYMAKEFYRSVNVSVLENENGADVYISNDTPKDFTGTVSVKVMDFSGRIIEEKNIEAKAEATSSNLVYSYTVPEDLKDRTFIAAQLNDFGEVFSFFKKPKDLNLSEPNIQIKYGENSITATTDIPAFYVNIKVPDTKVRFDRNFILMIPGKEYVFDIKENHGLTAKEISEKAKAETLYHAQA